MRGQKNLIAKKFFAYCASAERGIHLLTLDQDGAGRAIEAHPARSSFLAIDPQIRCLCSIDEKSGTLRSFSIADDGSLNLITQVETQGGTPAHLAIDPHARFVVVASYRGGVELFPLGPDGRVGALADIHQPAGTGPHERQECAHPHGVVMVGDRAYVSDLGIDRILVLKIEPTPLRFVALDEETLTLAPADGPRHLAFHPDGAHAVSINELNDTVTTFAREPKSGRWEQRGTFRTLPPDFEGTNWTAEIAYHPRADVCYASNRGHDSLAVFSIDRETGRLNGGRFIAALGKGPRHFCVDPSGKLLLIANLDSNSITIYRLDETTGWPRELLPPLEVEKPMCVVGIPDSLVGQLWSM